jgi:hypothetical protein
VIEDFKGGFFETNRDKAKQIAQSLDDELKTLIDDIQGKIKSAIEDLKTWYEKAAGAFYQGTIVLNSDMDLHPALIFVKYAFLGLPLTIFDNLNFKERKELKKQLLDGLDEAVRSVEDKIRENYRVVENLHEDLRRSQRGKNV